MPADDSRFLRATGRLAIGSLEPGEDDTWIVAQYNPRELTITQPITWAEHRPTAVQTPDSMYLDFGGMQPRTVQVELLFDGAESGGRVSLDANAKTVMESLFVLKTLASVIASPGSAGARSTPAGSAEVIDPYSRDEERRRPHFCLVTWGDGDFPKFCGVIESLVIKYQMWSSGGTVLRATATVSLKEASKVGLAEKARPKNRVKGERS